MRLTVRPPARQAGRSRPPGLSGRGCPFVPDGRCLSRLAPRRLPRGQPGTAGGWTRARVAPPPPRPCGSRRPGRGVGGGEPPEPARRPPRSLTHHPAAAAGRGLGQPPPAPPPPPPPAPAAPAPLPCPGGGGTARPGPAALARGCQRGDSRRPPRGSRRRSGGGGRGPGQKQAVKPLAQDCPSVQAGSAAGRAAGGVGVTGIQGSGSDAVSSWPLVPGRGTSSPRCIFGRITRRWLSGARPERTRRSAVWGRPLSPAYRRVFRPLSADGRRQPRGCGSPASASRLPPLGAGPVGRSRGPRPEPALCAALAAGVLLLLWRFLARALIAPSSSRVPYTGAQQARQNPGSGPYAGHGCCLLF